MNNKNRDLSIGLVYGIAIAMPVLLLGAVITGCCDKRKKNKEAAKENEQNGVEEVDMAEIMKRQPDKSEDKKGNCGCNDCQCNS